MRFHHAMHAMIATALMLTTAACAHAGASTEAGSDADAAGDASATAAGSDGERSVRLDRDELINTGGWTLASASGDGDGTAAVRAPGIAFDMTFDRDGITANGGCNTIRGTYTVSGKRMSFDVAITTRMSCTDDKNLADRSFVELMNQSFKAELLEPMPYRLRLTGDGGQQLVFQAKPLRF
jgi:heat shock protein HslJ